MAEEFEESEIIFKIDDDSNYEDHSSSLSSNSAKSRGNVEKRNKLKQKSIINSNAMNIPANVDRTMLLQFVETDLDGGDGEIVPPHVIVGRRVAGKMTSFSVCTGNGRTLKGRDLSEVRNSVLRMTGFLET